MHISKHKPRLPAGYLAIKTPPPSKKISREQESQESQDSQDSQDSSRARRTSKKNQKAMWKKALSEVTSMLAAGGEGQDLVEDMRYLVDLQGKLDPGMALQAEVNSGLEFLRKRKHFWQQHKT